MCSNSSMITNRAVALKRTVAGGVASPCASASLVCQQPLRGPPSSSVGPRAFNAENVCRDVQSVPWSRTLADCLCGSRSSCRCIWACIPRVRKRCEPLLGKDSGFDNATECGPGRIRTCDARFRKPHTPRGRRRRYCRALRKLRHRQIPRSSLWQERLPRICHGLDPGIACGARPLIYVVDPRIRVLFAGYYGLLHWPIAAST